MTIIREPSLFGIQELYEMEPTHRYEALISTIDLDAIYQQRSLSFRKTRKGSLRRGDAYL